MFIIIMSNRPIEIQITKALIEKLFIAFMCMSHDFQKPIIICN